MIHGVMKKDLKLVIDLIRYNQYIQVNFRMHRIDYLV